MDTVRVYSRFFLFNSKNMSLLQLIGGGHCSNSFVLLKTIINGKKVLATVDTGATYNFVAI